MPPGLQLLLPAALLTAGALVAWFAGAGGVELGRAAAASAAWASLLALVVLWAPRRAPLEFHGPALGGGIPFGQRLDATGFALGLAVLLPACLLLTFQRRDWQPAGAAALALAFSLTAVLADSLAVTALALSAAGSVLLVQVRTDDGRGIRSFWPLQVGGWLALLWAAAVLQATSGTSAYSAVPVVAAQAPVLLLMLSGAVLASSVLPWRGWTSEFWDRPRLTSGSLAIAAIVPVGFLVLLRTYEMGGGSWPSPRLNVLLALAGAAAAVGAGLRAQAASTRRSALGESVPGLAGFALVGIAYGSPIGLTAALACVLAAAVTAGILPLLPDDRSAISLSGAMLAAGLPPGIGFAARLLVIQATIEAGGVRGLLGVLLALAWLLELAAAARGSRLPATRAGTGRAGSPPGALAGLGLLLSGGVAFGLVASWLCVPAATELVRFAPNSVSGTPYAVLSAAGGWSAVALGMPAVIVALLLLPALRWEKPPVQRGVPEPLLGMGWAGLLGHAYGRGQRMRIPAEYQSLFNPRAVEAAMARGQPVLWAVLLLVLTVAVNR